VIEKVTLANKAKNEREEVLLKC